MSKALTLENFDSSPALQRTTGPVFSEEARLEAFEQGYKAGWDDCTASSTDEAGRVSTDFAANLKDLSFTFHEARTHVLQGIEPIMQEMVRKVLPELARQSLPKLILDAVKAHLASATDTPMHLIVAPASRAALDAILPSDPGFPLTIEEEETLAEGQVFIRAGHREHTIDLAGALRDVESLVSGFFEEEERQAANG